MKITTSNCLFLVCDIQERFQDIIYQYNSVVEASLLLVKAS